MLHTSNAGLLCLLTLIALAGAAAALPAVPVDAAVQAEALRAEAPGVAADVALPAIATPLPVGVAPIQTVAESVLAHPLDPQLRGETSPLALLLPRSDARAAMAAPAYEGAGPGPGQAAEMVAAGTLGALATFALKFEPLRRGLFLLAMPLYSRLRRSELLDNAVRERIHRTVQAHPGVSIIQVCRATKVGWGTAVYHLQRLERDRMIVSRRDGQYRRFFLNGHAPEAGSVDLAGRALAHPLAARVAGFVQANPGAAQKDVCVALGISPPLASKWLGRLLEAGLLTSQREWKLVRYAPTAALEQALARAASPTQVVAAVVPA